MSSGTALVEIARTDEVLARLPEPYSLWLSDSEQARLPTLKVETRRNHYLAGHWLTRELLSQAFGKTAMDWSLQERRSQAPQVLGGDGSLRVSISHSGDWIAAAVAEFAIGIDIEQRPRQLDAAIEALLLNAAELPGSLSQDELLQRWVVKEAWIKRRGESALPERLKQLQLHCVSRDSAELVVHQGSAYYCGLAMFPADKVTWRGRSEANSVSAFRAEIEP